MTNTQRNKINQLGEKYIKLFTPDSLNPRGLVRRETVKKSKKHKKYFLTELQASSF